MTFHGLASSGTCANSTDATEQFTVTIGDCDDGDPCTIDSCDVVTGCSNVPKVCEDDGNVCNGPETCDPATGDCVSGPALPCNDDGNVCNGPEHCDPVLGCVSGPPLVCNDDGNVCNGPEHCDPVLGCISGPPLICNDDGNVCNGPEHCDPVLGCISGPPLVCADDGNVCNGPEHCVPGLGCVSGPPLVCNDDGNVCNGPEHCDPVLGCISGPPLVCNDDGNVCNGPEHCDPVLGCVSGPPLTCNDDGNVCNGPEHCDTVLGCVSGPALVCDDGDPCTDDTCDLVLGCQHKDNGECACVTRTQGYWFNHIIAPKGINPAGCATLSAVFTELGTINLGFTTVNLDQAIGMFWTKGPSTPLCQARQKLATQLIAAIANATLLNTPGTACVQGANDLILAAQTAAAGCNIAAITAAKDQLDAFNNSGDALSFPAGLGACGAGKENKDFIAAHSAPPGASCSACP
jgi:hypothetical protein